MVSVDCFMTQSENRWLICCMVAVDKGGYIYNNLGTKTGNAKRGTSVLGSTVDDCYPIGNLTNEIIPASKAATFIYDYNKRPSFLVNYNFRQQLEGWSSEGKAVYSYSVNSFLAELVDLTNKNSSNRRLTILWDSYMAGLKSGSPRLNRNLIIQAIVQSFVQSPYLTNK